jgi:hypothetical protein
LSLLGKSGSDEYEMEEQWPDSRIFYGAVFVCLVISASLLLGIIYGNISNSKKEVLALLAIVIAGAVPITTQSRLIFEDWFDTDKWLLIHSFFCRDRRGRTQIGRNLHRCLADTDSRRWDGADVSLTNLLNRQPAEYLFALAAPEELDIQLSILVSLGDHDMASLLRALPDCRVRTKIVLIESRVDYVRAAALEVMPRNLWPRARRKLLRSEYVEARLAAVHSIPELHILARVCRDDSAEPVRLLAWQRLSSSLSEKIALTLIKSSYIDIRVSVLKSGKLPRAQLLRTCKDDENVTARALAWNTLRRTLTKAEAVVLFRSFYLDAKLWAVESRKLERACLRKTCFQNPEADVRASAWKQLTENLSLADAIHLIDSLHTDTRLRTVQSYQLPRERLLRVALNDDERRVRLETLGQVRVGLSTAEATRLRRSLDAEFRVLAIESGLLRREHIQQLCRYDINNDVRLAALAKLRS